MRAKQPYKYIKHSRIRSSIIFHLASCLLKNSCFPFKRKSLHDSFKNVEIRYHGCNFFLLFKHVDRCPHCGNQLYAMLLYHVFTIVRSSTVTFLLFFVASSRKMQLDLTIESPLSNQAAFVRAHKVGERKKREKCKMELDGVLSYD